MLYYTLQVSQMYLFTKWNISRTLTIMMIHSSDLLSQSRTRHVFHIDKIDKVTTRSAENRSRFVFWPFCSLSRFSLIAQEARPEWKTLLKIAKITQLYLCNDPDFCPTWGVHNNSYLHIRVNNSWRGKLIVNQPEL